MGLAGIYFVGISTGAWLCKPVWWPIAPFLLGCILLGVALWREEHNKHGS